MHERGKNNEEDDARDPKFHGAAATVPRVTSDHWVSLLDLRV